MNDDMKEELKDCYAQINYLQRVVDVQTDTVEQLREIINQYKMRQDSLVKALDTAFDDLYTHDAREQAEKITRVLEELEL